MKKIFTFLALLFATVSYTQSDYYKVVLKSENYTINETAYSGSEALFLLSDNAITVKPVGEMKLVKKAVAVKNTAVYFCEYQGKPVEVITHITPEKFKVTVRGENLKYVIESESTDMVQKSDEPQLNTAIANQ